MQAIIRELPLKAPPEVLQVFHNLPVDGLVNLEKGTLSITHKNLSIALKDHPEALAWCKSNLGEGTIVFKEGWTRDCKE